MDNSSEIRQGFLCPFCFRDLCDSNALYKHVEENHQETSSINSDAIDALKGAFGRAKQKILKIDFSTIAGTSQSREDLRESSPNYVYFEEEDQTVGIHRSLKSIFVSDRDNCVNAVAVDTNNLIIRLDKLINDCPDEASHFEKETVPWTADNTSACQSCSAKFYLTRRKHHCRLCGNVICTDCSKFLPFVVAQKLTNPAFTATEISSFKKTSTGLPKFSDSGVKRQTTKFLSSFGIETSKFGIEQPSNPDEQSLRVCSKCKKLLERRQEAMDQMSIPSVFVDMYEKLCQLITQISNLSPSYKRMAASLKNGESMYTLEAAVQLRKKLGSLQHEIQSLSERIEKWGLQGDPLAPKPTPRELILRGNIRYSAIAALQETVLDMPELPSKEEYQELKEKHKEKVRRQLEEEKEVNGIRSYPSNPVLKRDRSMSPKRTERRKPLKTSSSFSSLQNEGGWTPEPSNSAFHYNPFVEDEPEINPVQQQYIIIKHYLKQAAESGRLEELEMLEKNLKDIEEELKRLNLSTPRTD
uniref:FYVE-type domain-containing protein n=1 Tax=Panagrolaimus sp. ES5 TaxID=591445 RepID=A0AC34GQT6_9BILA